MKERENTLQTNLQELYSETEKWISDLGFYADELQFFKKLHNLYFSEMVENENLDEIREEVIRFQEVRFAHEKLVNKTKAHLHQLVLAINANDPNSHAIQQKHKTLQQDIEVFVLNFKANKKELFSITQNVLENQKEEIGYMRERFHD